MDTIAQQRCFNHPRREAAARCPVCRRFFCRECVTEHDERVLCAACLRRLTRRKGRAGTRTQSIRLAVQCMAAFLLLWLVFYGLGRTLLRLPASFHEGTLWRDMPWQSP
jgi:hypothetical protein